MAPRGGGARAHANTPPPSTAASQWGVIVRRSQNINLMPKPSRLCFPRMFRSSGSKKMVLFRVAPSRPSRFPCSRMLFVISFSMCISLVTVLRHVFLSHCLLFNSSLALRSSLSWPTAEAKRQRWKAGAAPNMCLRQEGDGQEEGAGRSGGIWKGNGKVQEHKSRKIIQLLCR